MIKYSQIQTYITESISVKLPSSDVPVHCCVRLDWMDDERAIASLISEDDRRPIKGTNNVEVVDQDLVTGGWAGVLEKFDAVLLGDNNKTTALDIMHEFEFNSKLSRESLVGSLGQPAAEIVLAAVQELKRFDQELDIVHNCLTDLYNLYDADGGEAIARIRMCLDEIDTINKE